MSTSALRPGRAFHLGVVLSLALVLCPEFRSTMTAQADQPKSRDRPFVAEYYYEYYYKARWGDADEFIRLFKKNHIPILKKQIETGRILRVSAVKPRYHATEDGRWDYRVTIVFKDVAAAHDASGSSSTAQSSISRSGMELMHQSGGVALGGASSPGLVGEAC
jgi:hypothetical protein